MAIGAPSHLEGGVRESRPLRDRVLLERYSRDRDPRTRGVLVERFLPLARSVARRYACPGEPFDDLVQVASLGLVKAIDRYDPARGYAFTSFAVPTIVGELKRHFRDRTWLVRPPRELQERSMLLDRTARELAQRLDRQPTVRELGDALGLGDEQVVEALQAACCRDALSLQTASSRIESAPTLEEELGCHEDGYAQAETRGTLQSMLALLSERQRTVLRMRFDEDLTQAEIGELLGVSQMQVSRIIRAALARLREIADQQARRADAHRAASRSQS